MQRRQVNIFSTGKCLPGNLVTASELEQSLGLTKGWIEKKSGVLIRHFVVVIKSMLPLAPQYLRCQLR